MIALCSSPYGESVDVTFSNIVCILAKLSAIKVN